jgi:hypothetical protein
MLAMLLPAFMPFIILPIGALVFVGCPKLLVAVGMIGGCEREDTPVPGGGLRLNADEARPLVVVVAGGGGSEKEEDEARCWVRAGRWS